uniref:Uncharacterized protein n=1 Tax=Arundo donax TaxID=35708 RepID=A0A0A8YBH0_ARUDO
MVIRACGPRLLCVWLVGFPARWVRWHRRRRMSGGSACWRASICSPCGWAPSTTHSGNP